ncbi:ABC transporter family substrate-binding protein [Wenjunlia tyrosinilytica]|uniref:Lipoprotein n=1 Tax=Wenjunlia tyrosinilytica TaxID=1544741 RepID=A0A917ZXV7_9ACTN|nr:ABC transporter family substrate-binding protein [Wenjunlia tyrosinilytica]GGO97726.1 lipoprotein [Wenjunlia tyrosinilytica]
MPTGGRHTVIRGGTAALAGLLVLPGLASCTAQPHRATPLMPTSDIAAAPRAQVKDGGQLRWAIDAVPTTFNVFQADATADSSRVTGAVLPSLFVLDERGHPRRNGDYLTSAEVTAKRPKQTVVYKINPKAVWTSGKPITAADFEAQWKALGGSDASFWPARNDGYRQIEKVGKGGSDREVEVTFSQPYADWQSLFTPLYPKSVTGKPSSFNDGSRKKLKETAGPFTLGKVVRKGSGASVTLTRNGKWWGDRAKLDKVVLVPVPQDKRVDALAKGTLDLADLDPDPTAAKKGKDGPLARLSSAPGLTVRKAAEAAFTQLTLNGSTGPLADEQVRRAVARAIDRKALAKTVLSPLGLPVGTLGSHLYMGAQDGYKDGSSALGGPDRKSAEALLSKSGWKPGPAGRGPSPSGAAAPAESASAHPERPKKHDGKKDEHKKEEEKAKKADGEENAEGEENAGGEEKAGREDNTEKGEKSAKKKEKKSKSDPNAKVVHLAEAGSGSGSGSGSNSNSNSQRTVSVVEPGSVRVKEGKSLSLRLLVPQRAAALSAVGDQVAAMLSKIGVRTEVTRVGDDSFFRDHVASGDFDLALFSWPATAFPATDARSIYAKPLPAPDGSLIVEQNFARVGTDEIDQLFHQASRELDPKESRKLASRADARIWAAAGSLPLYQRPEVVAVKRSVANAGAFGFLTPRYQDIGYTR